VSAESATPGLSAGELLRFLGVGGALLCLAGVLVCALFGKKFQDETYHRLMFGLFVLLPVVLASTLGSVMEETKTVPSCASCHVMKPYVADLTDPKSETLAAVHFKNRWIPENQCYSCHTSYGVHGTLDAKLGGLRHWWLYVTNGWKDPIRYRGKYPNANCIACHGGTPKFQAVAMHKPIAEKLASNEKSCASCHTPHPAPAGEAKP
jgi:cytochrome c nitrite reductase small subunit